MKKVSLMIILSGVLISTVFAASAFTSAELNRSSTVNVVADDSGALTLSPGTVGTTATIASNGELQLNASPSASGLNVEGTYVFGDNANPATDYMFTMTNTTANDKSVTVGYNVTGDAQGSTGAMTFNIYDGSGNNVATVTDSSDASFTASSGTQYYVVLETDTTGLDSAADLSGNLSFSV